MPDQLLATTLATTAVDRPRRRRSAALRPSDLSAVRIIGGALAGAAAIVGIVAIWLLAPAHVDRTAAQREVAATTALLAHHRVGAARIHARAAVDADRDLGTAHLALARVDLAAGDGVAAEGELGLAAQDGIASAQTGASYARAFLLEGDSARALRAVDQMMPRELAAATPVDREAIRRVRIDAAAAQGDVGRAERLLGGLLAESPRDSDAWTDLAQLRARQGNVGGAVDAVTRATTADPDNVAALTLRGSLVRGQFGLVAALPWFEAALARDPGDYAALIEEAGTLGDVGRSVDMLAVTRRAIAARPAAPEAWYLEAVLAARAGDDDLARRLLQRTGGRLDHLPGALLLDGALAYRAGDPERAVGPWRELVGRQPMNITARRLLGAALLRSGDARAALDLLRPIAQRGDADSYTLALVGRAFEAIHDRDTAMRYLDRAASPVHDGSTPFGTDDSLANLTIAAADAPRDPVVGVGYLRGLVEADRRGDALTQAQTLADAYPGAPPAQAALGDTLMVMRRYADAADAYRRAANLRFDEANMLKLIDALDHAGRRADAANALALFVSQNPRDLTAQRLAAHWQVAAGDWDDAVTTLETLRARIGNNDAALLAELAEAYLGKGDAATATSFARAAYRLAPMNPAATDLYGWALYQQGEVAPALQLLTKAVAIAPGHPLLHWHLGQALADSGRSAAAAAQIRVALADHDFADRNAAQAVLAAIGGPRTGRTRG